MGLKSIMVLFMRIMCLGFAGCEHETLNNNGFVLGVGGFPAYAIVGGIGIALLGTAIGIPAIGAGIIVGLLIWLIIRAVR